MESVSFISISSKTCAGLEDRPGNPNEWEVEAEDSCGFYTGKVKYRQRKGVWVT